MTKNARQRGVSSVTVHAVLAVAALTWAYMTWTRDKAQVQQSELVTVLDAGKRDIDSITYKDENRVVQIERKLSPSGDIYAWITTTIHSKEMVTHPAAPPPPAPAPAVTPAPAKDVKAPFASPPHPGGTPLPAATKGGDKAAANKDAPAQKIVPAAPPPAASTPPAAGTPPAAAPPPAPPIHEMKDKTVIKSFRGNEQTDKLLEAFAPMQALRALGKVDDAKLKELGLKEPKKSITVVVKEKPVKFDLGNSSYGSGDVYVSDGQGQVYLLPQRLSADFEFAESRLMERRLHRFERADITKVEVTLGAKKKVLVQQKRQDPVNYYWAVDATPDKRDDTLRNWMDKVLRLAISDYVAKGEEPQQPAMSEAPPASGAAPLFGEVMTLKFYDGSKEIGHASFSRYPGKGTQTDYFATTETTIGLVKLLSQSAESAIQDAEKW